MNTTMILVHYGSDKYDPALFRDIADRPKWTKPSGGFWASPKGSHFGWRQWCENETYGDISRCFEVEFSGRLLVIDSVDDLDNLPWVDDGLISWISFEKLSKAYDAVHLTVIGQERTRYSLPRSLYGWDCETVFVMNKNCLRAL